ncbi:DNA repair protein RecN [Arenicella sp. 4NH20-0111]|uniref:DNA repair protein RecN n=1 Tax=Arenicella sp. 4NH20-0111 TaxID=3127648 RepID=UPI00310C34A3
MALRELNIRNFAIIKQLELEVDDGLTVVTGETGAGKSIVLGALNLLLGSRAESDMIRFGEDQCEITALFSIEKQKNVRDWLSQKDLADENELGYCLVRRIVRNNKPTKCYINDQPTTLASLKELGLMLVDLHGQHEHQSLLRLTHQRHIIDQFAGHEDGLKAMAAIASHIARVKKELNQISQTKTDNQDRMELMSFQLNELDETAVYDGEFQELEQEHLRLSHSQALEDGIVLALDDLFHNDTSNVSSNLGRTINQISDLVAVDQSLAPAEELLNSALAQVEEVQTILDSSLRQIDQDPARLAEVEHRRDTLINLARKHRCSEEQLPSKHQELQAEYERLENQRMQPEKLQKQLDELLVKYHKIANLISDRRQTVAAQLSKEITLQMQDLGMRGGELSISVEPQISDELVVAEHGIDQVEFLVSTNHGMPLKPLNKTASGGELSRISLAIQVITSQKSDTPTLVFDEVDVGVGGKIAQIVGMRLRNLGENAQVLCITHQPQVAAQGHQHLLIDKVSKDSDTYSTLIKLDQDMRTSEIARMLGGSEITDRTRAHAQEMLQSVAL